MDLDSPIHQTQGDLGGTPFGMIETKRKAGKIKLKNVKPAEKTIATDLVWSDQARRQTGYDAAVLLKDGVVVLYRKIKPARMKKLGGALPQHDAGMTNTESARVQGRALEQRKAETHGYHAFDRTETIKAAFG